MLNQLKQTMEMKQTENGANAYNSTMNKCLDLFALGGAYRGRTDEDIIKLFFDAYKEDKQIALRLLFYLRDCRGGQGERRFFRVAMKNLAMQDPSSVKRVAHLVAEYGRYDDFFCFADTPVEELAFEYLKQQLMEDKDAEFPTLCAKWMPSENASSALTKAYARKLRHFLGMNSRDYRKMLSAIRAKLHLVETLMSENRWSEIEYDKIPSKAGLQYRYAFARHDYERYNDFMTPVENEAPKVNAGTLYPYEIVSRVMRYCNSWKGVFTGDTLDRNTLNTYWANLPDYLNGESSNALAVVDVSGSMSGTPMEVAVSLGMYMAEKNTGAFANHVMTFSKKPELIELDGKDFCDNVAKVVSSEWGYNTNLKATFDLILNTAKKFNLPQSEIPEMLYIISDMEFDRAVGQDYDTVIEMCKKEFEAAGYKLPYLVFWNVDSRNNTLPVIGAGNYALVSGFSPSIFEQVITKKSALELMMGVVNSERYSKIRL